ncbi:hypothetical protein [Microbacterium sp. PAMC21962]|uniref:hypothetical protein n=1 Tax=Microbacterium sp. PAMC21962 TaxID=2861280 RepID=UPI001C634ED3|nr:hypothetical protein [Microbacterium sp. PAMC21962]QYF98485.1 hypothetical protein KY498_04360 [Microbacterium sp. PAMC21962]
MTAEVDVLTWPDGTLVDVESIRANTDAAQKVAETNPADRSIRTPDWALDELTRVSYHAARMVVVIAHAEELKRTAATTLARAKATARIALKDLPAAHQTARIVLAVEVEQDAYDVAVTAFEYARRIGNLLSDYTSRVQSMAKLIDITYQQGGA